MIRDARNYSKFLNNIDIQKLYQNLMSSIYFSDIKAHGKDIPISLIPLFINPDDFAFFQNVIRLVSRIIDKLIEHYMTDANIRSLFNFSKMLEDLILLKPQYSTNVPYGRYDLFYNEKDKSFQFCEFNTDGSGGMSRDLEISRALLANPMLKPYFKNINASVLNNVEYIASNVISIYKSTTRYDKSSILAIVDFEDEGVLSDFNRFIASFNRKGFKSRFVPMSKLVYDGKKLRDKRDGNIIGCVFRRAVTSSILRRIEECDALINAFVDDNVIMIGSFKTEIAHSKKIFYALYHPYVSQFLSDDENEFVKKHIPLTYDMSNLANMDKTAFYEKDNWIIKPNDDFGSRGVVAGESVSECEWKRTLERLSGDENYIIQEFCKRYPYPVYNPFSFKIEDMPMMFGPYVSCGELAGFYSRSAHYPIIDFNHEGLCISTLYRP